MTFPGKEWEVVKPEEQGLDGERLAAAVDFLKQNVGRDGVKELVIVRRRDPLLRRHIDVELGGLRERMWLHLVLELRR